MMLDCYCDYDPPEFVSRSMPRARKEHRCEECRGCIVPGEQYEYVFGKWDGYLSTFKTCERCVELRQWVENNLPCLCWAHGNLNTDLEEAIVQAYDVARDEVTGLWFGYLRRRVLRDRHNAASRAAP
jgi:hypothetical protein